MMPSSKNQGWNNQSTIGIGYLSSGMTFYNSGHSNEWKNNLFITCLSGNHICRLVFENNKVTGEERLVAEEGLRFRDITQGKDGALYAVTDGGRLYGMAKKYFFFFEFEAKA